MSQQDEAWLCHQQQRWLRPDAHRWVRPDAARYLQPGTSVDDVFPQLSLKYSQSQPRVPAGSGRESGRWTDGSGGGQRPRVIIDTTNLDANAEGDGSGTTASPSAFDMGDVSSEIGSLGLFDIKPRERSAGDVQLAVDGEGGRPVDLLEERELGGHATSHIGRSEQSLLSEMQETLASADRKGESGDGLRNGSFPSLEAANKLVNSTIARNSDKVSLVANGVLPRANLDADFPSPTGIEAFARTERSQPYIRDTYGVRVVIVPDNRSSKGYRVETAFPQNRGR